ncbi:MAG: (Na+)-NQR maturation NqrM [Gammaproteobacteria bacterium]|nr:(Na+)-NQR maturation NqrM [Gammaproteobacteria bacterium]
MIDFLVIFSMFFIMVAFMSVGVLMKRKPISGSCGGLGNVGVEKACDCDNPCSKKAQQTDVEISLSSLKKVKP